MSEEKICDLTRSFAFLVFSCVSEPSARLPARERHSRETAASSLARPRRRRQVQGHFHTESVRMSLLPRWFDEATTRTLKLRFSKYSTTCVLNFVWPALKSVPRQ